MTSSYKLHYLLQLFVIIKNKQFAVLLISYLMNFNCVKMLVLLILESVTNLPRKQLLTRGGFGFAVRSAL